MTAQQASRTRLVRFFRIINDKARLLNILPLILSLSNALLVCRQKLYKLGDARVKPFYIDEF